MERNSFLFYRSFYEAIKGLPKDIQLEVYTAIMEYAIYGNLSDEMKPFANSVFTLVRPILDKNLRRYENGRKGGKPRPPKTESKPAANTPPAEEPCSLSFSEETERMKAETVWKESVCMRYSLSPEEMDSRLDAFAMHCNCERSDKPHSSLADAKRHFQSWMRKAYPSDTAAQPESRPSDYSFNGGFGGKDI